MFLLLRWRESDIRATHLSAKGSASSQTANKAFYCSLSRNKISINFIAHKIQRFIDVISRVKDNAAYISLEIFNAFAKNQTVDNNAMHAKPVLRVALKHIGL